MNLHPGLDDDAYQPAVAVIDDLLHSILQFFLALVIDHCHLILHAVHHQFFDGFAENIRTPDAAFALLGILDIADQVFCLLLASYDRRYLRLDVGADQMDGRSFTPNLLPCLMMAGSSSTISSFLGLTTP